MNALKQKRKELGLTQKQAANACGVSRRTYQTYEETNNLNSTYNEIFQKLTEIGDSKGGNTVLSIRQIKRACKEVFSEYPEVECAYLFGSYARGEATSQSDVDILVVCPAIGMRFFGIATLLEERLHKVIDVHTHRQLLRNETLMSEVLKDGIKVY